MNINQNKNSHLNMDIPNDIKQFINEEVDNMINWRALSTELTGNPNQITRTRIGKKYEVLVGVLRDKITQWKLINSPIPINIENKFNGIIPIQGMGVLEIYRNDEMINRIIFQLLSYDMIKDVYRLKIGETFPPKDYINLPGNEYPKYEFILSENEVFKHLYKNLV